MLYLSEANTVEKTEKMQLWRDNPRCIKNSVPVANEKEFIHPNISTVRLITALVITELYHIQQLLKK